AEPLPFARAAAALEIRVCDPAPELADGCTLAGVGDDDEMPVLRVAGRRRLLREGEALLEHLALDGPREVEALAHGACRREQLVGCQVEGQDDDPMRAPRRASASPRRLRVDVDLVGVHWSRRSDGPGWARTPLLSGAFHAAGGHRGVHGTGTVERLRMVDLAAVDECRVRVRR